MLGIAYRAGDRVVKNDERTMLPMEVFPPVDYDLIPVDRYFTLKGRRQLDYISSTGCLFRCAFCADPFVFNRGWQALGPERLGTEIEHLWKRYGVRNPRGGHPTLSIVFGPVRDV